MQHNLKCSPSWLPAALLFSAITSVEAQTVDSRVDLVCQGLGYQKLGDQNTDKLAAEIRTLREELRQSREQLDSRLQHIEHILSPNASKEPAQPQQSSSPNKPAEALKSTDILSVCNRGCDFNDLQKAVDAAAPGGEINVEPEISGSCAVINKPLRIIGKREKDGHRAHLVGGVCIGKAPLVTTAGNIVIEGFEISDINVSDGNGACLRLDPGTRDLTVRDIYCHDSQDGILGKSEGLFLIEDSSFVGNGFGNGQAHNLYIEGDEVLIRRSRILSAQNAGHSLKSGARKLTVEDSIIAALNGHNSRALDAYSGGEVVLLRNVIQQGPQSDNSDVIGLALESGRLLPDGHSLRLENNWVIFDDSGRGILIRGRKLGPITARGNTFVGLKGMGLADVQDIGNHWFETRKEAGLPPFDGTLSSLPNNAVKK